VVPSDAYPIIVPVPVNMDGRTATRVAVASAIVSLIPAAGACRVTTRGLRYRLLRETIGPGSRGLSNVAVSKKILVEVHRGNAWIVRPLPSRRQRESCR